MKLRYLIFSFCLLLGTNLYGQHLAKNTFELAAGIGRRGILQKQSGVLRSTITAGYNLRLGPVVDLKFQGDALYFDRTDQNLLRSGSLEHWAYGVVIGSDFKLNRVIFTNGIGHYVYFKSDWEKRFPNDPINFYTKIGFRYLITPHLTAGFLMRAHSTQADYIDFGMSVKF